MDMERIPVVLAIEDPQAKAELERRFRDLPGFELCRDVADAPTGLQVLGIGADAEKDMQRALMRLGAGLPGEIFLTGKDPDPGLLLRAMRAGIKEYLVQPVTDGDFASAIERFRKRQGCRNPDTTTKGKLVMVTGAKGGIGVTTVATNLAFELGRLEPGTTALLDLGRPMGEVPIFLDLEYRYTWADVAENIARLDATYLESAMTRHASGLWVLPSPGVLDEGGLEPAVLRRLLAELRNRFGRVVIDDNGSLDDASLEALEAADVVLLVMALSLPCLARVKQILETLRTMRPLVCRKIQLVANRHLSASEIGVAEAEEILQQKIFWLVPNDYAATLSAINQGKPLAEAEPKSPATRAIAALAQELTQRKLPKKEKAGLSLWKKLRNRPAQTAMQPAES